MSKNQKRWLCWGPAIAITAAYVISLTIHWAGGWTSYPTGVTGLVVIAVYTLELAGDKLGAEKPLMVAIRNDKPAPRKPLPQDDSGPISGIYNQRDASPHDDLAGDDNIVKMPTARTVEALRRVAKRIVDDAGHGS
jgi:hypothetical protein